MGTCRICGKQTLGEHQYCIQCSSAYIGDRSAEKRDRGHHGGSPARQGQAESTSTGLGSNYLKDGYFNDSGYLREEIYTTEATRVAGVLSSKNMTSAALRRFFNKLRGIDSRFKSGSDFEEIKPGLYAFQRDVAYAVGRGVVPEEFRQFINTNIRLAIIDPKHFKGFVEHFQSVLAYFKESANRR